MATTYEAIATVTVGSGGAANIEFTSIPATYTDLKLVVSARENTAAVSNRMFLSFNSSTTNFSWKRLRGNGSTADSYSESTRDLYGTSNGGGATTSTFSNFELYIPNYTSSNNKSWSVDSVVEQNDATNNILVFFAGLWSNTSAITSIALSGDGNFVQYSTATLYGIKNS